MNSRPFAFVLTLQIKITSPFVQLFSCAFYTLRYIMQLGGCVMPVDLMNTIENEVTIRAPRSRVWKALTTPSELGTWFHCTLPTQEFRLGEIVNGVSTYPGYEGKAFSFEVIEKVPEQRFSWRWSPSAASKDDPPTTVTFELEEVAEGTRVKVTESGFERISLERRAKAFEGNTKGWAIQMQNIHDYVEQQG